jgi:phytoene synthase
MASEDQSNVEKIVKNSKTSFFFGMSFLPKDQKRAMFSIYAFCRQVDDIADDLKTSKQNKKKKLANWVSKINKLYSAGSTNDFLSRELLVSIKKYNLIKNDFLSIIKGMKMDIDENIQFPSKKKLNLYCDRVAVAVGYLSIKIFGLPEKKGKKYAFCLGRAFQLTNIVRDFSEDLTRKRCYLPKNELKRNNIKQNIDQLKKNPKLQKIFQKTLEEANIFFIQSDLLKKKMNVKKLLAPEIMKLFYKSLHSKMYKKKINFDKKVRLNNFEKIYILTKFFLGV